VISSWFTANHAISLMNHHSSRKPHPLENSPTQESICQGAKLSELTEIAPLRIKIRWSALKPGAVANYHFQRWSLATLLTST
jgi:hypothetical protein